MDIDARISLLTGWLDAVQLNSAKQRIVALQDEDRVRDLRLALPAGNTAELRMAHAAMHEASHVTIAHRFGLPVSYAHIRGDGSGAVFYGPLREDCVNDTLCAGIAALAGPCVELVLAGGDRCHDLADTHDILTARIRMVECQTLAPGMNLSNKVCATLACCTVAENWEAIVGIARALFAAGDLNGQQIAALCGVAQ